MISIRLNAMQATLGDYDGMVKACEAMNLEESEDEDDGSESEEEDDDGGTSNIDDDLKVHNN